ncbi:PH domain-containing protein [Rothia aerolata]|uniref:YdbS-like PH domain-containing protein n=1 Tax=Rothia aerolata TaxID=1812262 RepID=A0A917IX34_9MICC|nr:PH domain-containing protein [Rothia aerolata]GGH64232.1 hypothetical protein GCM10007359_16340 [Rothia aerolata]
MENLEFRRAHVLSPLVNAWLVIFVALFSFGREFIENSRQSLDYLTSAPELAGPLSWVSSLGALWLPVSLLLLFALILLPFYIGWWFYSFAVGENHVYVKSGVLNKTQRQVRLDRVQSIDINRSLLPRLLGLAELKFDVADGSDSALAVKYLSNSQAHSLRADLLSQVRALKSDVQDDAAAASSPVPSADESEEEQIVRVPIARLLASMALNLWNIFALLVIVTVAVISMVTGASITGALFANFAVVAGFVSAVWKRFNTGYNFRLSTGPDGLKTRFGFADTQTQTVPQGRIQSLRVEQPFLWRIFGWYRVQVSLAGKEAGESVFAGELLPVGTREEIRRVLPQVLAAELTDVLLVGMDGAGQAGGFVTSPDRAKLFDPLTWQRNGFALLPEVLLARSGRLTRNLAVVPHAKIQALTCDQGPWARRRGLANLTVETAGGGVARVHHADAEVARALLVRQAQLAVG